MDQDKVIKKYIGDTLYIIESETSASATETAVEKVKRLILSDVGANTKVAS